MGWVLGIMALNYGEHLGLICPIVFILREKISGFDIKNSEIHYAADEREQEKKHLLKLFRV